MIRLPLPSDTAAAGHVRFEPVWAVEHGGLVVWLDELYVVPERREGGVGQALLLAGALAEARSLGCFALELEVDVEHARVEHLYARNGFTRLPRGRWVRLLSIPAYPQ